MLSNKKQVTDVYILKKMILKLNIKQEFIEDTCICCRNSALHVRE